ncbi:MAG: SPASM domain-containing protein [Candidatus Hodarchaeales archaeon]|jgi:radical SAM protein with 4Fe4S-binding SPASM domain
MQFDTFTFGFTFQCNLSCPYCYEKGYKNEKEFSMTEIEEHVYPAIESIHARNLDIDGGEPIVRWKDFITFLEHVSSLDWLELINICSNGIKLTSERVETIQKTVGKDIYLAFSLSLDALSPGEDTRAPRLHEYQVNAVKRLHEMKKPVILACTVNKLNLPVMDDYLQTLREMGILVGLTPAFFPPPGTGLSEEEMKSVDRLRTEHLLDPVLAPDQTPVPINPETWKEELLPMFEVLGVDMCFGDPSCSSAVCVRANGDVKGCAIHDFTLGNIREKPIREIYKQEYVEKIRELEVGNPCGSCRYVEQCRGGCKVRAKMETGDYLGGVRSCYYQTAKDVPHPDEARLTRLLQDRLESDDIMKYLESLGKND